MPSNGDRIHQFCLPLGLFFIDYNKMNDVHESRCEEVFMWQRHYGMEPRSDSLLTKRFARGETTETADAVARELFATHFIYTNTLYGEIIEDFMRAVAQRLRREYRLGWARCWEIVRFYAPNALKCMCVEYSGLRIPDLSTSQSES